MKSKAETTMFETKYPSKVNFHVCRVKQRAKQNAHGIPRQVLWVCKQIYESLRQACGLPMITNYEELLRHSLSYIQLNTFEVRCSCHSEHLTKILCSNVSISEHTMFVQRVWLKNLQMTKLWLSLQNHILRLFSIWSGKCVQQWRGAKKNIFIIKLG